MPLPPHTPHTPDSAAPSTPSTPSKPSAPHSQPEEPLVNIQDLTIRINLPGGSQVHASTDVSIELAPGTVHAIIGESGCGKSIVANTVAGILPRNASTTGSATIHTPTASCDMLTFHTKHRQHGTDLPPAPPLAGTHVGFVPQSAATFLTPVRTVGSQLQETIDHLKAHTTAEDLADRVSLPHRALGLYPHELSGGMAQRAAVAFALAGDPEIIVADEPTASLDPELKEKIFHLLRSCATDHRSVLLITHDIQELMTSGVADTVSVMYASTVVESGPAKQLFTDPQHPYTQALLGALPSRGMTPIPGEPPVLTDPEGDLTFQSRLAAASFSLSDASTPGHMLPSVKHPLATDRAGWIASGITKAFDDNPVLSGCSLVIKPGEIVGLSGPSGSGKTTLARIMCGLVKPDSGTVTCDGTPIRPVYARGGRRSRGLVNMLFQSPRQACDPRMSLRAIIAETSRGISPEEAAASVSLTPDLLDRRPGEVSDGQLQRAVLARVIAAEPRYVICDEVTAMLDPGTAAHTMTVLSELARCRSIGLLVVSHSPELLEHCCDRNVSITGLAADGLEATEPHAPQ